MKIRQKLAGRTVPAAAALVLLCSTSIATLFAQAPLVPARPDSKAPESPAPGTHASATFTYKVITAPQATWGYDVFADGRLMIHQTSVPALPGNEGFRTKEDATKVALLVIEKIRKGEMPPTISIDEMKTLSVIK
jgi:hypothetical protein